ncbi:hypothetical protein AK830_g901 [Neonectria ditissima]|uniref:Uncharacterized protein n=1 Tax=Neonectria ditissima TaxID=78410 RepID=A0A0P7B6Q5_9HYPO|nr:hypothetical protein AK830_g901 [Neonectria ditissima]
MRNCDTSGADAAAPEADAVGPSPQPRQPHLAMDEVKTCPLLKLPNEILLAVVDHPSLDRASLKSLTLASSRLFQLGRPRFYKEDGCETFWRAVDVADVDALERCARFDAAPVNQLRDVQRKDEVEGATQRECGATPLVTTIEKLWPIDHTAPDVLPEDVYDAARWLLDHGADPNKPSGLPLWRLHRAGDQEPGVLCWPALYHLLPTLLKAQLDRCTVDSMADLVSLLCDRGAIMPLEVDEILTLGRPRSISKEYPDNVPLTVLNLALLLECPSSVLECILTGFERRNFNLTTQLQANSREFMAWLDAETPSHMPVRTWVSRIVEELHGCLSGPIFSWTETYAGEMVDQMEEKVRLLVKHRAVGETEQRAFEKLASTVRELYDARLANSCLTSSGLEDYRLLCWVQLSRSMADLTKPELIDHGQRLHRFEHPRWDPRATWLQNTATEMRQEYCKCVHETGSLGFRLHQDMARYHAQLEAGELIPWYEEDAGLWRHHLKTLNEWAEAADQAPGKRTCQKWFEGPDFQCKEGLTL